MFVSLELDNPNRSYFPGQSVSGKVTINSFEERISECIYISFVGSAEVDFTSGKHSYSDREYFFDTSVTLVGNNGEGVSVPEGRSQYSFSFDLPEKLPSALRGKYGRISYYCVAGMNYNMNSATYVPPSLSSPISFTVNGLVDLNKEPKAKLQVFVEEIRHTRSCFLTNGSVHYTIKMAKSGFVSGEIIPIVIDIDNKSRGKVKIFVALWQVTYFRGKNVLPLILDTDTLTKFSIWPVSKSVVTPVKGGERKSWSANNLLVKSVPPSSGIGECKIITVGYELQVKIKPLDSKPIEHKFPIIIGTIPMRGNFGELNDPNRRSHRVFNSNPNSLPYVFEEYPDLPPPSYEEAVTRSASNEYINRAFDRNTISEGDNAADNISHFIPVYITY